MTIFQLIFNNVATFVKDVSKTKVIPQGLYESCLRFVESIVIFIIFH